MKTQNNTTMQKQEQLTEVQQVTQNICGQGITFYASDKCAYCDNYSGYGNPLCDACWEKELGSVS